MFETEWATPSGDSSRSSGNGLRQWTCAALVACWWLFFGVPAWAEHEVDHRFDVSGTVRAADGAPSAGVKVVVAHPRNNLQETVLTDGSGRYSVRLHLHDQDAGDPVTVTAGDEIKTIKADYDPKDHHTPRVVTVDFGPVVPQSDDPSMIWWYGAGGVALAGGVIYWFRSKRGRHTAKPGRPGRRRTKSHA